MWVREGRGERLGGEVKVIDWFCIAAKKYVSR